jgi:hypothetical protein
MSTSANTTGQIFIASICSEADEDDDEDEDEDEDNDDDDEDDGKEEDVILPADGGRSVAVL